MSNEVYLNHPTFGLLYQVCLLEENQEIFTTLYAQRLFFLVKTGSEHISFDPISRSDARLLVEKRLRALRGMGLMQDYQDLNHIYQCTFQ
ncbi:MAG: transcriptional coactivator PipX [Microcystaceae cyanobacterium]